MKSVMAAGLFFFLTAFAGQTAPSADSKARVQQEKKRIQLKLAQTRIRLLREDPKLKELNARIESLQRLLIRQLDSRKEMQALYKQLRKIDQRLQVKPSAEK